MGTRDINYHRVEGVGDGKVLTFEPEIIEGQPQLFYKVETIQKE